MSTHSHNLVNLDEIREYDDSTVSSIQTGDWFTGTSAATLGDLAKYLVARPSSLVFKFNDKITVDNSSMYTTSRDLFNNVPWNKVLQDGISGISSQASLRLLLEVDNRKGLWLWLAHELLLRNLSANLTNTLAKGAATWVWAPGESRRWYRHRIAGPLCAWEWRERAQRDASSSLVNIFANSPLSTGEIYEQIVSRPEILTTGVLPTMNTRVGAKTVTAGNAGKGSSRYRGAQVQQASVLFDLSTGADEAIVFP